MIASNAERVAVRGRGVSMSLRGRAAEWILDTRGRNLFLIVLAIAVLFWLLAIGTPLVNLPDWLTALFGGGAIALTIYVVYVSVIELYKHLLRSSVPLLSQGARWTKQYDVLLRAQVGARLPPLLWIPVALILYGLTP